MKTVFFFIACSCLINGLTASFAGFPLGDEENNFDSEISPQLDIFFPDINNAENLIVPFPTGPDTTDTTRHPTTWTTSTTTTTSNPTSTSTTTTSNPTSTTTTTTSRPTRPHRPTRPTPTTTTSRPTRPTRPTHRPTRPTRHPLWPHPTSTIRPRPELERIQVYKNAFRSLGPLAGRLVNIVSNNRGKQMTAQRNEIVYNLKSFRANRGYLDEEDNEV